MKKALLLFAALCIATMGFAQLPFATLTHNDSIRVFHGMNALQSAHAAAVNGDVINLSSGVFDAVNITKAVTIRGAGMFNNNATGLISTTIRNSFSVNVSDTVNRLSLIGLYFASGANITMVNVTNPQFLKCRFQSIIQHNYNCHTYNAQFINCIIQQWINHSSDNNWYATGTSFYNCVILNQGNPSSPDMLVNCIANQSNNANDINNKTIMNCILYSGNYNTGSNNGYTSFNTIGIYAYYNGRYYSGNFFDLTNMGTHNLHNYSSSSNPFSLVFQTFRGTYSDGMSMALNANIATTILGDDSTQVGIYGGQFPWDPSVSNPLIGHATAGRRTNAQGMLEVNIEILSNDEE